MVREELVHGGSLRILSFASPGHPRYRPSVHLLLRDISSLKQGADCAILCFKLTNCKEGFWRHGAVLIDGFARVLPGTLGSHVPNVQGAPARLRGGEVGGFRSSAARHCPRRFLRFGMKPLGRVAGEESSAVVPTDHGNREASGVARQCDVPTTYHSDACWWRDYNWPGAFA